jgi:hypothetical protein
MGARKQGTGNDSLPIDSTFYFSITGWGFISNVMGNINLVQTQRFSISGFT